jgi:hypothetical protein
MLALLCSSLLWCECPFCCPLGNEGLVDMSLYVLYGADTLRGWGWNAYLVCLVVLLHNFVRRFLT